MTTDYKQWPCWGWEVKSTWHDDKIYWVTIKNGVEITPEEAENQREWQRATSEEIMARETQGVYRQYPTIKDMIEVTEGQCHETVGCRNFNDFHMKNEKAIKEYRTANSGKVRKNGDTTGYKVRHAV